MRTPPWMQSRLNAHATMPCYQLPRFPTSAARGSPPSAQLCVSPAPPYPLRCPASDYSFDVPGGARPYSDWVIRRCRSAMSPTVEELSPSVERPLTTVPVPRHPVYGVEVFSDWVHRRRVGRAGSDEGPSAAEGGLGRFDQVSATSPVPWPPRLRSSTSTQRYPVSVRWHLGTTTHAHPESF